MARAAEFRDLGVDELQQRVQELDGELFTLRIQKAMGQLDRPLKLRDVRRDLARIKTVLREKAGR
jgi:large subunit ribosomal protein L29